MGPQKAVCLQVKAVCPQMAVCPQEERGQDDRVHEHSTRMTDFMSTAPNLPTCKDNTTATPLLQEEQEKRERGQDDGLHQLATCSETLQ